MRTMWDSVTASDIPTGAGIVGGYVDGNYKWSQADWDRFPRAVHVPIAVFASTNAGVVLDVENGNATPGQSPEWTAMRRRAGVDPTIYCSLSIWDEIARAHVEAGVSQPHYWVAQWDGIANIPAGAIAKQYADDHMSGGHFDLSAVADHWPGVDGAHPPTGGTGGGTVAADTYTVVAGDTLYGIAARYGMTWQTLYNINRAVIGNNPNLIRPGEVLLVRAPEGLRTYVVVAGDNLSSIAARYHTTWQAIYAANRAIIGSNPNLIHPGQRLVIP